MFLANEIDNGNVDVVPLPDFHHGVKSKLVLRESACHEHDDFVERYCALYRWSKSCGSLSKTCGCMDDCLTFVVDSLQHRSDERILLITHSLVGKKHRLHPMANRSHYLR
jgi:hypothetical protein